MLKADLVVVFLTKQNLLNNAEHFCSDISVLYEISDISHQTHVEMEMCRLLGRILIETSISGYGNHHHLCF